MWGKGLSLRMKRLDILSLDGGLARTCVFPGGGMRGPGFRIPDYGDSEVPVMGVRRPDVRDSEFPIIDFGFRIPEHPRRKTTGRTLTCQFHSRVIYWYIP